MSDTFTAAVEVRSSADGPMLHGVILTEGRAARGGRAELFAPGAVVWPSDGIAIRLEHRGAEAARAVPTREGTEVRISTPATPDIFRAVRDGRRWMSVEFTSLRETRTAGGVREIESALVDGAALVETPEYQQTRAEVREVDDIDDRAMRWL